MRAILFFALAAGASLASHALRAAEAGGSSWTCEETASIREGRTLMSCGIGVGDTEDEARRIALRNARDELEAVCSISRDCARFYLNVVPLRTECRRQGLGYRCTRGLRATITAEERGGRSGLASSTKGSDRFAEDLEELDRLHDLTHRISKELEPGMGMSIGRRPPPEPGEATPEDKTLFE